MSKVSLSLNKAIDLCLVVLRRELADVSFEVTREPEPGVDAWIWILLPPAHESKAAWIRKSARQIIARTLEETEFNIIPIVDQKEPVHG